MSDPRDTSPPAFPVHPGLPRGDERNGMSLRDYFAGQALATLAASELPDAGQIAADDFALAAYEIADAMLARRSAGEGSP